MSGFCVTNVTGVTVTDVTLIILSRHLSASLRAYASSPSDSNAYASHTLMNTSHLILTLPFTCLILPLALVIFHYPKTYLLQYIRPVRIS